ncbi:hypothetical protein BaRGS_00025474 [Batillaria attramentaria]|uniref:Uncharacterized protein n=1 Tax=Batillaria attramentaria TaxID=370345 RepID=A0ABD0K896_9CAEN
MTVAGWSDGVLERECCRSHLQDTDENLIAGVWSITKEWGLDAGKKRRPLLHSHSTLTPIQVSGAVSLNMPEETIQADGFHW